MGKNRVGSFRERWWLVGANIYMHASYQYSLKLFVA